MCFYIGWKEFFFWDDAAFVIHNKRLEKKIMITEDGLTTQFQPIIIGIKVFSIKLSLSNGQSYCQLREDKWLKS